MLEILEGEEADAATLSVVRAYLKDNNIQLRKGMNPTVDKIIEAAESESLPFPGSKTA